MNVLQNFIQFGIINSENIVTMSWGNQGNQGWGNQGNQGWNQGNQGQGWGQGPQQGQGWGQGPQQGWGNQGPQQGWGNQGPQQGWGGQGQQGWGGNQGQQQWGGQGQQWGGQGQQWGNQGGWNQQQGQGWGNQQDLFNPNMEYVITSAMNRDMALDVSQDPEEMGKMILWSKHGEKNQRFRIRSQNGRHVIFSSLGATIEVPQNST